MVPPKTIVALAIVVLVEAMVAMWEKVGVKVKMVPLERGRYTERVSVTASYPGMAHVRTMEIEPYPWLSSYHSQASTSENRSHVNDPVLDGYVNKFKTTLDMAQAKEFAQQIQLRVMDQAYIIKYPAYNDFRLVRPRVKGFVLVDSMTAQMSLSWAERVWLAP